MTNKEAKEKLYMEWQKFLEDNIDYAGISEAYKMAFKALDQEVCGDAIDRQAVLDATICDGISCKECAFFTNTLSDCLLHERIKRLPSVNPQTKTDMLDKLTEIIEPLRHLSFDEMSDVEWQILQIIDKYAEQNLKTGHWIEVDTDQYACSNCRHCFSIDTQDNSIKEYKLCPNCGYHMIEP